MKKTTYTSFAIPIVSVKMPVNELRKIHLKKEVKGIMEIINKEIMNYESLEELDFKAGYIAGKINEKASNGLITQKHQDALMGILYTSYKIMRDMERGIVE